MNELKRCPFCGATAQVIEEVTGFPDELEYFVLCDNLECENRTSPHSTKMGAINAWNHRVDEWISVRDKMPESGVHVLLSCEIMPNGSRYVCDGYYAAPKTIISEADDECMYEYDDDDDEYYLIEGFYETIKNWDEFYSITIGDFVTHWRPLPEPPKV